MAERGDRVKLQPGRTIQERGVCPQQGWRAVSARRDFLPGVPGEPTPGLSAAVVSASLSGPRAPIPTHPNPAQHPALAADGACPQGRTLGLCSQEITAPPCPQPPQVTEDYRRTNLSPRPGQDNSVMCLYSRFPHPSPMEQAEGTLCTKPTLADFPSCFFSCLPCSLPCKFLLRSLS